MWAGDAPIRRYLLFWAGLVTVSFVSVPGSVAVSIQWMIFCGGTGVPTRPVAFTVFKCLVHLQLFHFRIELGLLSPEGGMFVSCLGTANAATLCGPVWFATFPSL